MAEIDNPSFETGQAASPHLPEDWDETHTSLMWEQGGWDNYERGWSDNEDSLAAFDDDDDLEGANYSSELLPAETYELEWLDNENAVDEWPASEERAEYGEALDEFEDYEGEWPARHRVKDTQALTATFFDTSNRPTLHARLNHIKAVYNTHGADAAVHLVADATNVITSPDASDEASSVTLMNEIWVDMWLHISDGSLVWHLADTLFSLIAPTDSGYPGADYGDVERAVLLANVALGLHLSWADNTGPGNISAFTSTVLGQPLYSVALPGVSDDYEAGWRDNETSIPAFIDGVNNEAAEYVKEIAFGLVTEPVETYEPRLIMNYATSSTTPGDEVLIDPTGMVRISQDNAHPAGAEFWVQTRSRGSALWVTRHVITSGPLHCDLDPGFIAVRVWTETWAAGTPDFRLVWRPMES